MPAPSPFSFSVLYSLVVFVIAAVAAAVSVVCLKILSRSVWRFCLTCCWVRSVSVVQWIVWVNRSFWVRYWVVGVRAFSSLVWFSCVCSCISLSSVGWPCCLSIRRVRMMAVAVLWSLASMAVIRFRVKSWVVWGWASRWWWRFVVFRVRSFRAWFIFRARESGVYCWSSKAVPTSPRAGARPARTGASLLVWALCFLAFCRFVIRVWWRPAGLIVLSSVSSFVSASFFTSVWVIFVVGWSGACWGGFL